LTDDVAAALGEDVEALRRVGEDGGDAGGEHLRVESLLLRLPGEGGVEPGDHGGVGRRRPADGEHR
jgi:hypothetical protein